MDILETLDELIEKSLIIKEDDDEDEAEERTGSQKHRKGGFVKAFENLKDVVRDIMTKQGSPLETPEDVEAAGKKPEAKPTDVPQEPEVGQEEKPEEKPEEKSEEKPEEKKEPEKEPEEKELEELSKPPELSSIPLDNMDKIMLQRGKKFKIVLPKGKGKSLYTNDFNAAKEMAKEYGRGTRVIQLDKDVRKMRVHIPK